MALYRKYRSKSLDEIVGQSHITDILRRAIDNGKISHAYLLTGPRGVGKTSVARILAYEINKLPYSEDASCLDIIEIDAASNNSVEDVRDLRDKVQIAPVSASKKIYIIDEVHMLSKQAFNALLKTLEEPPEHVVFILATTDADKLPATIISRVQRFNFRSISPEDATKHLAMIARSEKIDIEPEALDLIALHGRGSFRDSIGLLDQMQSISDSTITRESIEQTLGLLSGEHVEQLIAAHRAGDMPAIVRIINQAEATSVPAAIIAEQVIYALNARLAEDPALAPLLDRLLDVSKSSWPYIKLMTALTPARITTTNNAPLAAAPTKAPAAKKAPAPATQTPDDPPAAPAPEQVSQPATSASEQASQPEASAPPSAPKLSASLPSPSAIDWPAVLETVKSTNMGLHTLLTKTAHDYDGSTLTLYSGKPFYKKQIDKQLAALSGALASTGHENIEISVLATAKPPADSQTASVIAIMGGGEEVTVNG